MPPIVTLDAQGIGCAVFPSEDCVDTDPDRRRTAIEATIGTAVELLGTKHLDSDGRDVDHPVGHGMTMIGFHVVADPA